MELITNNFVQEMIKKYNIDLPSGGKKIIIKNALLELEKNNIDHNNLEKVTEVFNNSVKNYINTYLKDTNNYKNIDNYINNYLLEVNDQENAINELLKLSSWFQSINLELSFEINDLIIQNKKIVTYLKIIIDNNQNIYNTINDYLILDLIELYCSLNNIRLNQNNEFEDASSLQVYLNNTQKYPLLTKEQEILLAKRIENGDKQAEEVLVYSNMLLVANIANIYYKRGYSYTSCFTIEDLIQEGIIGLMKAVKKFDYRKGYKFSTYATWWIRQSITRSVVAHSKMIRLPDYLHQKTQKIYFAEMKMKNEFGMDPTKEELATVLNMKEEEIEKIKELPSVTASLNQSISDTGDDKINELVNAIPDDSEDIVAIVENRYDHEVVEQLLSILSPKAEFIVRMRYGIICTNPNKGYDNKYFLQEHSLQEIADCFNTTRENMRQTINRALVRMYKSDQKKKVKKHVK